MNRHRAPTKFCLGLLRLALIGAVASSCKPAGTASNDGATEAPRRFEATVAEPAELASLADPEPAEPITLPLINAPARPPRNIAGLMFDIGGGPPTAATIQTLLNGEMGSLRRMYQEISFGMQDLNIELLGPFTLPQPTCLPIVCCGPKPDQPNGPEAAAVIAGLPKKYDHYFYIYGRIPAGATCGTWGDEGTPPRPAVYSSYSFHQIVGYSQELGHNFGMTHEPIMTCPGNVPFLDDPTQCTHHEYGSTISFMGSGAAHPSAYHKVAQGWLSKCNGVKVGASATFTLLPQEIACDGVQILQIPAPKSRPAPAAGDRQGRAPTLTHYYAELRTPRGFDGTLRPAVAPMVVISIGPDFQTAQSAPYVYVLDQTPEATRPSLSNAGLTAGQTFQDPAGGLTIAVGAIDQNHADVTVTIAGQAANTCLDNTAFVAPGPPATSCGAISGGAGGAPGIGGAPGTAGTSGGAGRAGAGGGGGASPTGAGGTAGSNTGAAGSAGARSNTGGSGNAAGTGNGPGSGGSAVAGTTGSAASPPTSTPDNAGCGCRVAPAAPTRAAGALWLFAAAVLLRRGVSRSRNARRSRSL